MTACVYGNYPSSSIQKKHLFGKGGGFFFKDPVSCRWIYYMNAKFHKHRASYGSPINYKLLQTARQLHQAGSDRTENLHEGLHNSDFPLTSFINQRMHNARYTQFQDFHLLHSKRKYSLSMHNFIVAIINGNHL